MEKEKWKIFKPTHVTTDVIWIGETLWPIGIELEKKDLKMYDLHGKWISAWFINDKIKEIEK